MEKILRAAVPMTKTRQLQNPRNRQDLTLLEWEIGVQRKNLQKIKVGWIPKGKQKRIPKGGGIRTRKN